MSLTANLQHRFNEQPKISTNGDKRSLKGEVVWTITTKWTVAGPCSMQIPVDLDGRPHTEPEAPWWTDTKHADYIFKIDRDLFEPYIMNATIFLDLLMIKSFANGPEKIDPGHRTWICSKCGRINMNSWLGPRKCDNCSNTVSARHIAFSPKLRTFTATKRYGNHQRPISPKSSSSTTYVGAVYVCSRGNKRIF